MIKNKYIVFAGLVAVIFLMGNVGCAEKVPAKNEIKVTTPGGTKVTIEKPVETTGRNNPPVNP
jgi:hypothetical protein